jgi:hypothetical protein
MCQLASGRTNWTTMNRRESGWGQNWDEGCAGHKRAACSRPHGSGLLRTPHGPNTHWRGRGGIRFAGISLGDSLLEWQPPRKAIATLAAV